MRVSFWCAIIGLLAVGTAKAGNLKTVQAGIEWLYSIHGNDIILERVDRIFPSACNGLKLNLIIPEKIDNRTVMGMRARVFDGLRGKPFITYVNIPQSTKFIEGNAAGFSALPHLKFIQVSESNLHFESVGGALYSKGRRSLLKWPSEFQGKAILPSEVESIERSAFDGCNQLEAINIPKKVVGMLPNFSHCTRLKEFVVANDNGRYKSLDGAIYDSAKTILKAWPRGRRGGACLINGITEIGSFAFAECEYLTSVEFPNSLVKIGNAAFKGCQSLVCVRMPSQVKIVGDGAFIGCIGLKTVYMPKRMKSIGSNAFQACRALKMIEMPSVIEQIGHGVFWDCRSLERITLPEGMDVVGPWMFCRCEYLAEMRIPNGVTNISTGAFSGCRRLKRIDIPESLECVGDAAFTDCSSLERLALPHRVSRMGNRVFLNCHGLTNLVFYGDAPVAGSRLFENAGTRLVILVREGTHGWPDGGLDKEMSTWPLGAGYSSRVVKRFNAPLIEEE